MVGQAEEPKGQQRTPPLAGRGGGGAAPARWCAGLLGMLGRCCRLYLGPGRGWRALPVARMQSQPQPTFFCGRRALLPATWPPFPAALRCLDLDGLGSPGSGILCCSAAPAQPPRGGLARLQDTMLQRCACSAATKALDRCPAGGEQARRRSGASDAFIDGLQRSRWGHGGCWLRLCCICR
jgi:hypothetical protein